MALQRDHSYACSDDFYTRFEEDIFGLPTKKLNEQVKDFLNDGLDTKVKEIRALSILGPGHHYNADDTIPPNWKTFVGELLSMTVWFGFQVARWFQSGTSTYYTYMFICAMCIIGLLNYQFLSRLSRYSTVRFSTAIQKSNLWFGICIIIVMTRNCVCL